MASVAEGNFLFTSESVGEGHPGKFLLNCFEELVMEDVADFFLLF